MTKRIIALTLLLASCTLALFSCGASAGLEKTTECYKNSLPTKIVTNTVQQVLDNDGNVAAVFNGNYVTVTGKIGGLNASVRTYERDVLNTINAGAGSLVIPPIEQEKVVEEFLEGYGRRTNGGEWRPKGLNFAPAMGSIAIKLNENDVTDVKYVEEKLNNKLTFTVPVNKIEKVFGYDFDGNELIESDTPVKVEITNNGAVVTGITISYSVEASVDFPARDVIISTTYSYDVEKIEIATGEKK